MSNGYQKAGDDIVFEQFDNDLVILNLAIGQYFGVNASGAEAWRHLMAGASVDEISCGANSNALDRFLDQLSSFGLVRPTEVAGIGATCVLTDAPTIEAFDDLSDLLLADPIHDVDTEAGWPKMPDQA